MATSFVKINGLREFGARMKSLTDEVQVRIARTATNKGAQIIKQGAKQRAPIAPEAYVIEGITVQPGNIPEKIVVKRVPPAETTLTSEHLVVVLGGARNGYASRVGALQEFGTVKMPAQPFMRPAFDEESGKAEQAIVLSVRSGILAAVSKL